MDPIVVSTLRLSLHLGATYSYHPEGSTRTTIIKLFANQSELSTCVRMSTCILAHNNRR